MHCLAPHFLLFLPLSSASRHALPHTPPAPLLLPSHPAQARAGPLRLPSARSPSRAAAPVSDDDEDEEDDEEIDIRDDADVDEEYDDDDDEELDEESGVEEEEEEEEEGDDGVEELEEEEGGREGTAARRRRSEEYKSQRVGKLVAEVREFGEDIIDYNELAGIYDFPIDKFQVE